MTNIGLIHDDRADKNGYEQALQDAFEEVEVERLRQDVNRCGDRRGDHTPAGDAVWKAEPQPGQEHIEDG